MIVVLAVVRKQHYLAFLSEEFNVDSNVDPDNVMYFRVSGLYKFVTPQKYPRIFIIILLYILGMN